MLTEQAASVIAVLTAADSKGLDPEDYDGSRWLGRLSALRSSNSPSDSELARFDVALTVSLMRYISDLHLGRANASSVHIGFDLEGEGDLSDFIARRLLNSTDLTRALDQLEPPYEGYRRTERALQDYLAITHEESPRCCL